MVDLSILIMAMRRRRWRRRLVSYKCLTPANRYCYLKAEEEEEDEEMIKKEENKNNEKSKKKNQEFFLLLFIHY